MNDSYEKLIRDYAEGSLSGHARQEFELRLKNEPALASELDLYLALKATENQRLKKKLSMETADDSLFPEKPSILRRLLLWLTIGAIFVLGAMAAWKSFKSPEKMDIQKMAQAYSSPYPPPVASMGGNDTISQAIQQAYLAYRTGNFDAAAQQLTILAQEASISDEVLFYTGESLLQTGQWEQAIMYFNRVQPGYWREIADWRCALALIQHGKNAQARLLLEKLLQTSRREQAEKLLHAMEE